MKRLLPLWLDFVKAPPSRQAASYALLALSLALAAFFVQRSASNQQQLDTLQRQVAGLRQAAERQRLAAPAGSPQQPPPENRWRALFRTLEGAAGEDVTLLNLQPGAREIVIDGEARDLSAALDYTGRLRQAPALASAYLSRYERLRNHPRQPVRFTVLAAWRGVPPAQGTP